MYNQDILMLLVPDSKYGDKPLIHLGIQVIDKALHIIIKKELSNASNLCNRAHLLSVISIQVNVKTDQNEVLLDLRQIQGDIKTTRRITIPPSKTFKIQGLTKVRCHTKMVLIKMEALV